MLLGGVTWLVVDTGEVIEGAHAVRDYVVALHASLTDMRTSQLVVGDDSVYLEGDCAAQKPGAVGRRPLLRRVRRSGRSHCRDPLLRRRLTGTQSLTPAADLPHSGRALDRNDRNSPPRRSFSGR